MVTLGARVKDRISGFTGILVSRTEYLNGCVRVGIQPPGLDKEGKPHETQYFDEQEIDTTSKAKRGGPMPAPPPRANPR